jgi:hypothetical protein
VLPAKILGAPGDYCHLPVESEKIERFHAFFRFPVVEVPLPDGHFLSP